MDDGSAPLRYGKVCEGGCASCSFNGGSYMPPVGSPPGSCTYPLFYDENGERRDWSQSFTINGTKYRPRAITVWGMPRAESDGV